MTYLRTISPSLMGGMVQNICAFLVQCTAKLQFHGLQKSLQKVRVFKVATWVLSRFLKLCVGYKLIPISFEGFIIGILNKWLAGLGSSSKQFQVT